MSELNHINVLNPERHGGDGLNNSYISYEITSRSEGKEFKVRRRYQDFLWLLEQLKHNFPERIIPPLPDKNRLEYLGRFTPDFIKRRQLGLKRFLWRIESHPQLKGCEWFQDFLRAPIVGISGLKTRCNSEASISCDSKESLTNTSTTYLKPVIDSLGDVLSATSIFSRSPKQIPEQFLKLKKDIKMVKNHLCHLERLFSNRVSGHQPAIIEGMKEIAGNFDELSASIDLSVNHSEESSMTSPPFVKSMLSRVSATMTQCAHLLDKSIDDQELNLLAVLLEYSQYCDSALEIIETRDRRQVEVEELTKLAEGYEKEIKELDGTSVDVTSTPVEDDHTKQGASFLDYLSNKWDSWKGVDPITARKNRLHKAQTRLKETKTALKTSLHLSNLLDSTLSQEIAVFLAILREELGREFLNHSKSQVNYHETNLVYWKDFLAWLDNPPKHL